MKLNARSIALRGIGFGALAVALHGFVPVQEAPIHRNYGGGGGWGAEQSHVTYDAEFALQEQIKQEDEILVMAIAQLVAAGVFG